MESTPIIKFDLGTLILESFDHSVIEGMNLADVKFDQRTLQWRCPAQDYREIVYRCYTEKLSLRDEARRYNKLNLALKEPIKPRKHQQQALAAWQKAGSRGVVCLPTGAGKTILAVLSIAETKRPTLVVVPTIDLLNQWVEVLGRFFQQKIGAYGGGQKDLQDLTVATYDSAFMMIETLGNRFGLIIFDECHHLPSPQYQLIAKGAIAPFRLGLSATIERSDGKEELIYQLLGDLVFEGTITEMVSNVLAPYDVISIEVPLTDEERMQYEVSRDIYVRFVKQQRIQLSQPGGWQEFIRRSATVNGGREAMLAYREQKRLAQASSGKLEELWCILKAHPNERTIIFTNDNALAYQIGQEFFLPVLTHQTKAKERKKMLDSFRNGDLDILVTSKVLNEGVDVPEASIGVVVSGSGTVREHVQRLGRILRHKEGKRAVLYELIAKDTNEYYVNKRRRMHHAYQGPSKI
ncbi:MAG: DEAD/DEAH box helicase [Oligoflexus sp.]